MKKSMNKIVGWKLVQNLMVKVKVCLYMSIQMHAYFRVDSIEEGVVTGHLEVSHPLMACLKVLPAFSLPFWRAPRRNSTLFCEREKSAIRGALSPSKSIRGGNPVWNRFVVFWSVEKRVAAMKSTAVAQSSAKLLSGPLRYVNLKLRGKEERQKMRSYFSSFSIHPSTNRRNAF